MDSFYYLQIFADAGSVVNASIGYVNAYTGDVEGFAGNNDLSAELKTFYDTELLENARIEMYYAQFAKKQPLPANNGTTVEWRKWNTFAKAGKLTEGVIPTGQKFGVTKLNGSIEQYGTYTAVTDKLELRAYDDVILGATEEMGASAAETQETLIRDTLLTGTNVLFADKVTTSTGAKETVLYQYGLVYDDTDRCILSADMVNKARMLEHIADLVKEKRIEGISDLNDESNREGMRVVVELKKDANPQVVLNQLYSFTQLQDTVGVIMLALDGGVPKVMNLKTMLQRYIEFQDEVVRRRTQFDLRKAEDRAHILEGLKRATDIVDEIIAAIRACKGGKAEAKAAIMEKFEFDDLQATAIVNFQLGQLAGLEILKIENELGELHAKIDNWREILADDAKVLAIVKEELLAMRQKYGDDRRTEIATVSGEVDIEDLIPVEDCVYLLTHYGYVKRQPTGVYHSQRRGGRGITGLTRRDEDFVEELFIGSTHDYILFVTDQGRVYRIKGYEIPEGSRTAKGVNIVNLLPLAPDEKVQTMLKVSAESDEGYLIMVTKNGVIKRTPLASYRNIRKSGLIAISMDEGDSLAWTRITSGSDELIVATHNGMAIHFTEEDVRVVGRVARGVKAITLDEGDYVVGMATIREGGELLTVTEQGLGRRTPISEYRLQYRGGKGIKNYSGKGGAVAGVKVVDPQDDIILISLEGIIIRMHVEDINVQSRYAGGVRVMRLGETDRVVTVARTPREEEEPDAAEDDSMEQATDTPAATAEQESGD